MPVLDQIIRAIRATSAAAVRWVSSGNWLVWTVRHSLEELVGEADRLRRALAALTPGGGEPAARSGPAAAEPSTAAPAAKPRAPKPPVAAIKPAAPARTAPGATKTAILDALGGGEAMTASEIAAATGLGRATISTTLTRLAGAGVIAQAQRGYQLKSQDPRRRPRRVRDSRGVSRRHRRAPGSRRDFHRDRDAAGGGGERGLRRPRAGSSK